MKEVLGVIIFFAVILAGVWFAPVWWRAHQVKTSGQPSIVTLSDTARKLISAEETHGTGVPGDAANENQTPTTPPSIIATPTNTSKTDITKLAIKVMNGGAMKGSAAKALEIVKNAGYAAATVGNATGDYTGVSVYYAKLENKADAEALRILLSKTYSNPTTQAVADSQSETASAPIVVMVGK